MNGDDEGYLLHWWCLLGPRWGWCCQAPLPLVPWWGWVGVSLSWIGHAAELAAAALGPWLGRTYESPRNRRGTVKF